MTHHRSAFLGLALLLAACTLPTPPETSLWEGDIQPIPPNMVSGSVAAVSQFGETLTSIELQHGTEGETYTWWIERGTCAESGLVQGGEVLYPTLTAGEDGTVRASTSLPGHFVTSVEYAAKVLDDDRNVLACGALRRVE